MNHGLHLSAGSDARGSNLRYEWGRAILAQRELLGLTQKQLAESVGVTEQAVSSWERGLTSPRPHIQVEIAKALRISWAVLFKVSG